MLVAQDGALRKWRQRVHPLSPGDNAQGEMGCTLAQIEAYWKKVRSDALATFASCTDRRTRGDEATATTASSLGRRDNPGDYGGLRRTGQSTCAAVKVKSRRRRWCRLLQRHFLGAERQRK